MKRLLASFSIVALFIATFMQPLQAAIPNDTVGYLQGQSKSNEWVIMALKAANQSVSANHITVPTTNEATSLERIILGVVAGGGDPFQFQGRNLIAELDAKRVNNQIGVENQLNDDMWGILAYYAAGVAPSDTRIQGSKQHLVNNQNSDGGWGFANTVESDSNDTAVAIMALIRAGLTASDSVIDRGFAYIGSTQADSGGYAISDGFDADSASTSWVISALQAAGKNPHDIKKNGKSPFDFLALTKGENGGYKWKPGDDKESAAMSAYAAIALAGTSYPVNRYTAPAVQEQTNQTNQTSQTNQTQQTQQQEEEQDEEEQTTTSPASGVDYRIEGANKQLCSGNTDAANALELLEKAAVHCNLDYVIQETSFGSYVQSIESDEASGSTGWLYLVNWESPTVGADDYDLENGDYVTWYFGKFDIMPLRMTMNSITESSENILVDVNVHYFDGQTWFDAVGVTVSTGNENFKTNSQGKAAFSLALGQTYEVYATGGEYIRSAVEVIRSENVMKKTIPLEANIISQTSSNTSSGNTGGGSGSSKFKEAISQIPEPEVGFRITPQEGQELLAFGDLHAGTTESQTIQLENTGDIPLEFSATVEGHQIFTAYLLINNLSWEQFVLELLPQSTDDVSVTLTIPAEYTKTGKKTGELIFWATP